MKPWERFSGQPASAGPWERFQTPESQPEKAQDITAAAPERRGSFGGDLLAAWGVGSNQMARMVGSLYGITTGNMDNALVRVADTGIDYWQQRKSDDLAELEGARNQAMHDADGLFSEFKAAIWHTVKNPRLLAATIAEQAPTTVGPGAAGRAMGYAVARTGAGRAASSAAGTGTAIGTGAAMQGASVGDEVYRDLTDLPEEVWQANDDYRSLIEQGYTAEEARHELALGYSRGAAAASGALSVTSQAVPGGATVERVLGGGRSGGRGGLLQRGLSGGLGEAGQEMVEEGGGQFIGNVTTSFVDPSQSWGEGVGGAAGIAAVAGGVMGAGAGMAGGRDVALDPDVAPGVRIATMEQNLQGLQQAFAEAEAAGDLELASALEIRYNQMHSEYNTFRLQHDPTYIGDLPGPGKALEQAHQAVERAGQEALARGGDSLDAELAKADVASIAIPTAVQAEGNLQATLVERMPQFDTAVAPDQDVTATDLGIVFPADEQATVADRERTPFDQPRDMSGIDGLITIARRLGFEEEVIALNLVKTHYAAAERLDAAGNAEGAAQRRERGDRLYRDITEGQAAPMSEYANQFPAPYEHQGEVVGGEVATRDPGFTFGRDDIDGTPIHVPTNLLEDQSRGRLPSEGMIYGQPPAAESDSASDTDPRVGRHVVERMAQRPIGIGVDPGVEARRLSPADMRPEITWAGRRGDGYPSQQAAEAGVRMRQESMPHLEWRAEQMPSGRWQVAGYAQPSSSSAPQEQAGLRGERIDAEWVSFSPESQTLGIPRSDMPQIKAADRSALVQMLRARGIDYQKDTVPASSLKPTQAEFSESKVTKAKDFEGGDRSILISSDGHVLDGHHQWLAKIDTGEGVPVIRLDAPISQLLEEVKEFPSLETSSESAPATQEPMSEAEVAEIQRQARLRRQQERRRTVRPDDSLIAAVIKMGGISPEWRQDITGDDKGNRNIPGVGYLFTPKGTSPDDMAVKLYEAGYLTEDQLNDLDARDYIYEAIEAELSGRRAAYQLNSEAAMLAELEALEDQYQAELDALADQREAAYAEIAEEHGEEAARLARLHDEAADSSIDELTQEADSHGQQANERDEILAADAERDAFAPRATRDERVRQGGQETDRSEGQETRNSQADGRAGITSPPTEQPTDAAPQGAVSRSGSQEFSLARETEASRQDREQREADTRRAQENQRRRGERQDQVERERSADRQAADESVDRFELGQTADQQLSGMGDMFSQPRTEAARSDSEPNQEPNQPVPEIDDFGETLGGARKHLDGVRARMAQLTDEEIAKTTLSKMWPKSEIDKIEDNRLAALYHAIREEIPSKPRVAHKLRRWVDTVKMVRSLVDRAESMGPAAFIETLRTEDGLKSFADKVELLGHLERADWGRIGSVSRATGEYRNESGKMVPGSWYSVQIDGRRQAFYGKESVAAIVDDVNGHLGRASGTPRLKFEIRQNTSTKEASINFASDSERRPLKTFPTVSEARAYLRDHYDGLVAEWERVKERDNVHKRDLRGKNNAERVGADRRQGRDVTQEEFSETFGFRGVQFGNWVSQGRGDRDRQGMLNQAYDALLDLAEIVGIPPKAVSLNGELGLAFGARGSGWAAAHYEPSTVVINLTKTHGAGSLAHEWFHALDHYFQRQRSEVSDQAYITNQPENYYRDRKTGVQLPESEFLPMARGERSPKGKKFIQRLFNRDDWVLVEGVRPEVGAAFAELVEALNASPMTKRASLIDKGKKDGYWSRIIERAARSFENYVITRMADQGKQNDYLANVVSPEQFVRNADRYPYLLDNEIKPVAEAFDNLFSVLETRETERGVEIYEESGLYSGYERETSNLQGRERGETRAEEPSADAGRAAQFDLFNPPEADKRQAYADLFGTVVKPQTVSYLKASTDTITSADDLAHLLAPLRKEAQETFYAVVTDADGKVLRLMRHTKGLKDSASVDPTTVIAEAASIEGAHTIHYGHNHPSGNVGESRADVLMTNAINKELDGTGISPGYHVVIGKTRWGGVPSDFGNFAGGGRIEPRVRRVNIPVTERRIMKNQALGEVIDGPAAAMTLTANHDNAIFLLNTRHNPVAIIPMTEAEMGTLREGGRVNRILSAINTSNANAAIVKGHDREAVDNVTRMMSSYAGMNVLDALVVEEWGVRSLANEGNVSQSGAWFSRNDPAATGAVLEVEAVEGIARDIVSRLGLDRGGIRLEVLAAEADLPAVIRQQAEKDGATGQVQGVYHDSTLYIVADKVRTKAQIEEIVAHEGLGHFGARKLFGNDIAKVYDQLFFQLGGAKGMTKRLSERGVDFSAYLETAQGLGSTQQALFLTDEFLAHLHQADAVAALPERIRSKVNELYGALRDWLRRHNFLSLARFGDADLAFLLKRMRESAAARSEAASTGRAAFNLAQADAGFSSGTFDSENPDIRLSRSGVKGMGSTDAEFNDTAAAYGGEAAWQAARNAGQTKLNYRQWVQVRTPAFKHWFGDWENGRDEQGTSEQGDPRTDNEPAGRSEQATSAPGAAVARRGENARGNRRIPAVLIDPETGEPRLFYHGTSDDIAAFDLNHPNRKDSGWLGRGVYVASDARLATRYAKLKGGSAAPNVLPLFVRSVEDVYTATQEEKQKLRKASQSDIDKATQRMAAGGYDGAALTFGEGTVELATFKSENVKSAIGNRGTFDPANPDVRFSRTDSTGFSVPDETLTTFAIRKIQDKFKVLKDLQANIIKAGGVVDESADAYLAEELFHGKSENDLRLMREQYVEPLAKKMAKFGISREELDRFLYARHAPERNRHIASINQDMPDGGSGMTNAQAADILAEVRGSGKQGEYDQLAAIVYDMLQLQRDLVRQGGLESDATLDAWEAKYRHYVPLKGWAEDTKGEGRPRTGRGFTIGGRESKRAMGRESEAASPTSFAIIDLTEKLIRRRKNEVGNALLNLVQKNPNEDYWQVFTDENPDVERRVVQVRDPVSGAMVDQVRETPVPMHMMQDRYFSTKKGGQVYFIKLKDERLMKAMKNLGPESNNGLIRTLSSVTRVMSSLNTSYSPEFVITNFARDIQTALLNLQAEQSLEDGKAAGARIAAKTAKDVPRAMRAIYASLRGKELSGKAAEWQQMFDQFRKDGAKTGWFDMKDLDGQAREIDGLVRMAQGGVKGNAWRFARGAANLVENLNSAVENAVRLSAYTNAVRAGIPRAQAASLAKNMTVNFNRKGEIGTTMNALYMFANASTQGVANFARTMLTFKPGPGYGWHRLNNAQKLGAGIVAGAYFLAMANRYGAGDDDDGENYYDKVPDYIKERNIVIMKSLFGGEAGEYWKIPMPYGYNVFGVLGTGMEAVLSGSKSGPEAGAELALATLGSFSPIGFEESKTLHGLFLKNATPTIAKPVADIALNENFMGSSIYTENLPFGTPKPASSLGRRSTPEAYNQIVQWMNQVTGGSQHRSGAVDINPDVMRYIVDYFGGSAYGFVGSKLPDVTYRYLQGMEVEAHQIPFVGRVTGKVMPYRDMEHFYQRRAEIGQIRNEARSLQGDERLAFMSQHRHKLRLHGMVKATEKRLASLRAQRDRIYEMDIPPAERDRRLKEVERHQKEAVDRFNRAYREAP